FVLFRTKSVDKEPLHSESQRFYYARTATCSIRAYKQRLDHPSIPDRGGSPRSFLAPYDHSTSSGSSTGDPESATSDQCCLQACASAWLRTSAAGRDNTANVVNGYCAKGNHRRQTDLRVARRFHGRRLARGIFRAIEVCAVPSAIRFWRLIQTPYNFAGGVNHRALDFPLRTADATTNSSAGQNPFATWQLNPS